MSISSDPPDAVGIGAAMDGLADLAINLILVVPIIGAVCALAWAIARRLFDKTEGR